MVVQSNSLFVPEGIRFSCSECANCCLEWPVPVTRQDFEKINQLTKELSGGPYKQEELFRVLRVDDEKLSVFSHSLEKRSDGKCEFLNENNRCSLHEHAGPQAKPSMCRLFPYTFTGTPDGVYSSISFASTAVLFNEGLLLEEQVESLEAKYELFKELFPGLNLNWDQAQVVDGTALNWQDYKEREEPLIAGLAREASIGFRAEQFVFQKSESFRKMVPSGINLDNMAGFEARPKLIDQVLIKHLLQFYCPTEVFGQTDYDFNARSILEEILKGPDKVEISRNGQSISFGLLYSTSLKDLGQDSLDLIRRFLYLRIFSKLFFGPGFNYLSVVSGFSHLCVIVVLARLCLKIDLITGELDKQGLSNRNGLIRLAEYLRTMERRLTVAVYSEETVAMLEVLLASPNRLERLLSIAA